MTNRTLWIAAIAAVGTLAVTQSEARADYYDGYGYSKPEDKWKKLRFEGGIGGLIGSQRVGWVAGTAGGMHFDGGLRMDRIMVYGEYDFLSVGETRDPYVPAEPGDEVVRGFMHRLGASLRYSLASFGGRGDVPVRGDIWVETGLGNQEIRWHEGGRLGRRDVSFGFGAQATFRIGREKPRYIGIYYAMKAWVARGPGRKNNDPTCAGPCDEPTPPSPYDFGIFFNFGVPFGR